ncbi:MAG: hypothetical protein K2X87_29290 [Gemmataceae bacterium]|nr:hypothetical protein [Gemmataceae bacterium]
MRRPLLAGLALVLAAVVAHAADTDPIKAKLDQAKARYEQDIEKHRKEVGKWFDGEIEKARGLKDNKKAVDRLTEERAAFESSGLLPDTKSAKQFREKGEAARAALDRAYQAAVKSYTSPDIKNDKAAAAVEKEFVKYLNTTAAPRLIGRWKRSDNYGMVFSADSALVLYLPNGQLDTKGKWSVEKDGIIKQELGNGWTAEGRFKEPDTSTWNYRGPRGEVGQCSANRTTK